MLSDMPNFPADAEEADILAACQKVLGYQFQNIALLREALTHSSAAATSLHSNERLEFLGDSVLGLICVEQLYLRFPTYREGEMTRVKSAVVSREPLAAYCESLELWAYLFAGNTVIIQESMPTNIKSDLFEAIVGAIYLDGGLEPTRNFVLKFLDPEIDRYVQNANKGNFKSILQQIAQQRWGTVPRYQVLDSQGPEHQRSFKICVIIEQERFAAAWGPSKKVAELRAAENALAEIEGNPIPHNHDPV